MAGFHDQVLYFNPFDSKVKMKKISTLKNNTGVHSVANHEGIISIATLAAVNIVRITFFVPGEWRKSKEITSPEDVKALALNKNGSLLATMSKTGTFLRLFDVKSKAMIREWRRGYSQVQVQNISFDQESQLISVATNEEVVNVVRVSMESNREPNSFARIELPPSEKEQGRICLLYTSDAADE